MESVVELTRELLEQPAARAGLILVASLIAGVALNLVLRLVVMRVTRRTRTDLDDRLMRILRPAVFMTVVLLGGKLAVLSLDLAPAANRLTFNLIQTLLVLLWMTAGVRMSSAIWQAAGGLAARVSWLDERTIPLFDNLSRVVLIGGAIYALMVAWSLDVKPWLASAGIAGIALGFAAKDTLANLFGGIYIMVDAPYKIGDWVNLDSGERGRVSGIGLRSTRLITRDDVEIILPNAQIANGKIVNESGGPSEKFRVEIRVGVAYGSDVDRVKEVLLGAAKEVEFASREPEPRIRFAEMGDSALIFRVLCWVEEPVMRGQCIDALNTRVYKRLADAGLEIPFPQRVVHLRQAPVPESV